VRLLVFGGWGQFGAELALAAEGRHELLRPTHLEADVTDEVAVEAAVRAARPDAVVNAAAFHQVERCEVDPGTAMAVNTVGAIKVARAAAGAGARVVLVSSDYVFDGEKGIGYAEDDRPSPVNLYGVSKAAGELGVRIVSSDSMVVRLSGLFGHAGSSGKGGNFVETVLSRASAGEPLSVVDDQRLSPTAAADAAARLLQLLDGAAPSGTYHLANQGSCSWFELAAAVLELSGLEARLTPRSTGPDEVRRPRVSVLADTRTGPLGLAPARPWRQALAWYLEARPEPRFRRSPR
jgi:dTDP-4-dehydrorhamnose reductase